VVDAPRKHGSFDTRWPCVGKDSEVAVPAAGALRPEEAAEGLDWELFSNRYFPGRRRHNMEALTAYAAYKQGREWRTTPGLLRVVPTEQVPAALEWDEGGTQRLLAAIVANPINQGETRAPREV